jgi:hypothetical protein
MRLRATGGGGFRCGWDAEWLHACRVLWSIGKLCFLHLLSVLYTCVHYCCPVLCRAVMVLTDPSDWYR